MVLKQKKAGLKAYTGNMVRGDSSIARHGNRALLSADAMTNMFVADQEAWMRAYEKVNRYDLKTLKHVGVR